MRENIERIRERETERGGWGGGGGGEMFTSNVTFTVGATVLDGACASAAVPGSAIHACL